MSKIDDGGAAFATPSTNHGVGYYATEGQPGLTKRDYFAAAALPALIARHRADVPWRRVVPLALEIADALIAASKPGGPEHG